QDGREQRVGGAFLQLAPRMKAAQLDYCANHPRAVQLLDRLKDTLSRWLEQQSPPGSLLALTVGLSQPFRRLDKYPALLTELQRHTEESHLDRGDTQRSVFVYKEMAASCSAMRRQKELELEVLAGTVDGCDGEELQSLGELQHVGPVILVSGDDRRDRYLALFHSCLVQLSLANGRFSYQRLSVYVDSKLLRRPGREKLLHSVKNAKRTRTPGPRERPVGTPGAWPGVVPEATPTPAAMPTLQDTPPRGPQGDGAPHVEDMQLLQVIEAYCYSTTRTRHTVNSALLDCPQVIVAEDEKIIVEDTRGKVPVLEERRIFILGPLSLSFGSYSAVHSRYTIERRAYIHAACIAWLDEAMAAEQIMSLVDTVYALRDQVKELRNETSQLTRALDEERQARHRLEALLRQHLLLGACDQALVISEA
ncbi:hypothetical protein HPB47_012925, partial [Ixodes persulcatus]